MNTLLSFSLIAVSIPLTLFLCVLFYFWRVSMSDQAAEQRGMFRFNDGRKDRWVDPISVMMAFENHPEYAPDIHPKLVANGNRDAIKIVVDAIKTAFGVVEYTDPKKPGLTVNEMLHLWTAFYSWVDLQKKSTEYERIYAVSTEQTSSESEAKTTNSTSDSGSTATEELQNSP